MNSTNFAIYPFPEIDKNGKRSRVHKVFQVINNVIGKINRNAFFGSPVETFIPGIYNFNSSIVEFK